MSEISQTDANTVEPRIGRSLWGDALLRILRDWVAIVCLLVILLYAVIAIASPFVFSDWGNKKDFENMNAAPSLDHPLGTDEFGQSVLQKVLLGATTSMTVGFMSNIIAVPLGMLLGVIAGYYGKFIDDGIVWFYTTLSCVPGFILLIALKFAFQGKTLMEDWSLLGLDLSIRMDGIAGIYIALGVMSWIGTCRLVRAETMRLREMDYVLAARASGRGGFAILFRHILPNVSHIGIINFSLGFVGAISAEVMLSFLGIGVVDRPSWGQMINAARLDLVVGRWWQLLAATIAMFLIVLAWSIFGDRLRDALDPRLKNV